MEITEEQTDEHGKVTTFTGEINGKEYKYQVLHDEEIIREEANYKDQQGRQQVTVETHGFDEIDEMKESHQSFIENIEPQLEQKEQELEQIEEDLEELTEFEEKVKEAIPKANKHLAKEGIEDQLEKHRPRVQEQREWLEMLRTVEEHIED